VSRPFWSVMIPTYNCAHYLRQTLASVLAQDPGPERMQIEVVDDCSTKDDPEAVVRELGRGRVAYYRQPKNVGAIGNFNTCVARSTGHWVHLLHGDDYVLPGFYESVETAVARRPDVGMVYTRAFVVDAEGRVDYLMPSHRVGEEPSNDPSYLLYENILRTPAVVVARAAYESIGGYASNLAHTADWEMWARLTARCGALGINEPLVCYRDFSGNDTARLSYNGSRLQHFLDTAAYFRELHPTFDADRFRRIVVDQASGDLMKPEVARDSEAVDRIRNLVRGVMRDLSWKPRALIRLERIQRRLHQLAASALRRLP
jgi:glycosyltransferase involved in cell wall biosynthesis